MTQNIELKTSGGSRVLLVLENQCSGLDDLLRRWTFEEPYWRCVDTGELAEESVCRTTDL
jgi:hypothetical protein